jgi:hypothetical protein
MGARERQVCATTTANIPSTQVLCEDPVVRVICVFVVACRLCADAFCWTVRVSLLVCLTRF